MVAVGLLAYRASQTALGGILDCKTCGTRGQALERGWVNVLAGDAWAITVGPRAGVVLRGPARFEAAGGGRIALSSGSALVGTGPGGRAIVLLPRDEQAGIEGASVGAAAPGTRLVLSTSPEGNRVAVLAGEAMISATSGEKKLGPGQIWETGKPTAAAPPDAPESKWLDELSSH